MYLIKNIDNIKQHFNQFKFSITFLQGQDTCIVNIKTFKYLVKRYAVQIYSKDFWLYLESQQEHVNIAAGSKHES